MNALAATPPVQRWRLRASDFELLLEAGALIDARRAELIDGDIYTMSPQLARHARAKTRLASALIQRLAATGSDPQVLIEVSVIVASDSVPEPDIIVSTYTGDRFVPAETIALVIEVVDTTLTRDLGRKATLYGAANIHEYWIVDVDGQRVITHRQPGAGGYAERNEVPFGEVLTSVTIDGLKIAAAELKS